MGEGFDFVTVVSAGAAGGAGVGEDAAGGDGGATAGEYDWV